MSTGQPSNPETGWREGADTSPVNAFPVDGIPTGAPVRTSETPLRDWYAFAIANGLRTTTEDLVASGVAPADLEALPPHPVQSAAEYLGTFLQSMVAHVPDLSLRAAVGWVMVSAFQGNRPHPASLAYTWEHAHPGLSGLGEFGWAFAAAGLNLEEALALCDRGGSPDLGTMAAMAALRGCPTPVG